MKFFFIFIALLMSLPVKSESGNYQVNLGVGMINASYSENPSGITSSSATASKAAASGSASIMPFEVGIEKAVTQKRSYTAKLTLPGIAPSKDSYLHIGVGANFYFKSLSSVENFSSDQQVLTIETPWRFYWGIDTGATYLVYTTKVEKKSDLIFELGAHVGILRKINSRWAGRAEIGLARGLGVQTSAMTMKIIFGAALSLF